MMKTGAGMGFQEILRALPMTDESRELELHVNGAFLQTNEYSDMFKRKFEGSCEFSAAATQHTSCQTVPLATSSHGFKSYRSLSHYLLSIADPLCASFPPERRDDLAEYVRQKMLAFLSEPSNVAVFGRRKAYEASWFFERPRPYLDRATPSQWSSLSDILSNMLGTNVVVQPEEAVSKSLVEKKKSDDTYTYLYGCRHKWLESRI